MRVFGDEGGLDDAPAVGCADEPPGEDRATKDHDPAVAAVGDARVGQKGSLNNILRGGDCCGGVEGGQVVIDLDCSIDSVWDVVVILCDQLQLKVDG